MSILSEKYKCMKSIRPKEQMLYINIANNSNSQMSRK